MITSEDVREELARIAPARRCDRLAELSAPPLTWAEGPGQPGLEWRAKDGRVVIRGSDGAEILKPSRKDANSLMGMRCAR